MKTPLSPPKIKSLIESYEQLNDAKLLSKLLARDIGITDSKGRYLPWDKLRFVKTPDGLTSEEYWLVTRLARNKLASKINLVDVNGLPFQFCITASMQKILHWLDQHSAGQVSIPPEIANSNTRDQYLIASLIEEAISSSQLEGASTTRNIAENLLQQSRKPRDKSEQMIVNNYNAMLAISELKDEQLTPELIFHFHKILTEDTLDDPSKAGALRTNEDKIQVVDNRDGEVLYTPPLAELLSARLAALCDFANADNAEKFIHPVIKAITLHFMLGYEHPFVDGNGRTARAIFYWYMAKQGYWLTEFVSISKVLKAAPAQYAKAYLHTETDSNDLTYFLIHQLEVLQQSFDNLFVYLASKVKEQLKLEDLIKETDLETKLNHRQLDVLSQALKYPKQIFTIEAHRTKHNLSYQTARTDLLFLADSLHLLEKQKRGKGFVFLVSKNIETTLMDSKK